MTYRRPCLHELSQLISQPLDRIRIVVATAAILLAPLAFAQEQPQTAAPPDSAQVQVETQSSNITIPAGTHLALVLTQPVQTRYIHRGDDIYAQVTSPVDAENQVVIPAGTFVQGIVDKIQRREGRGELRLQSMSVTFQDGYVTPIEGPIVLETTDGYAIKDPGSRRVGWSFALPLAGIGLGALIGHSVGTSQSTLTSSIPTGCNPAQFGCLTSSMPVPGSKGKDAAIGAGIGGAVGMVASLTLLTSSRHFYIDAGAPVELTLQQDVSFPQNEVAKAVRQSQEHAAEIEPVAPRPTAPVAATAPANSGMCYTPGMPGPPPTVIPGAPGPNGVPGPSITIPGTPGTPRTTHPCP